MGLFYLSVDVGRRKLRGRRIWGPSSSYPDLSCEVLTDGEYHHVPDDPELVEINTDDTMAKSSF